MGRVDIGGIDAIGLDRIDMLEHALGGRPALGLQQNLAAGAHERQGLERLAPSDRAHDVDARDDRAVLVGGPADEGEDAVRREAGDAAVAVEDLAVANVTVDRVETTDSQRPRGRRFGALVHAILAIAPLDADRAVIERLTRVQAKLVGASSEEAAAAITAAERALAHPVLRRAALRSQHIRREAPVLMRLDDGTLVEGVVDLAFQDTTGSFAGWTVVDFKTAHELEIDGVSDEHLRQVAYYCKAIGEATGAATRGIVLII